RRHTRFSRDWSSDVCSSDLEKHYQVRGPELNNIERSSDCLLKESRPKGQGRNQALAHNQGARFGGPFFRSRITRASRCTSPLCFPLTDNSTVVLSLGATDKLEKDS